ncbi:TPA: helix-turn-helix transcriptional regulator [Streptococcus suis]|uniref:Helix-turn-helix transcriptional regulator n=2 Tax=Streptococcus suis TaxID=1307 RepID=A0A426TGP8_STRSU|nr:helix-turn-helix transcriptional regulator [Streptococcus suis]MCQ8271001.1 helix-turn-helix domain-containing protein [Streptococcus suis]MCQ8785257.1 helix-turn-helix domain-containing protein [Streptococcus suis]NQH41995.1 helix-turn-helix transcriptional regulator [Streptococcus suis]NQH55524.1 helix-turn-helix transcriptional regulator [Streptococcus suis]NQL71124.1 helix-turn-helix transcriptional regulator [Streptococcus suis]
MANNIRRLLEQRGLNPRQMALELDLKYTTVNDWVNAKTYPRIDKIELMANFFGVQKSDLVENFEPSNPTKDSHNVKAHSSNEYELIAKNYDAFVEEFSNMFSTLTKKQQTKLYKAFKKSLKHNDPERKTLKKPSDIVAKLNNNQNELKQLTAKIKTQEEEIRIGQIAFEILSIDDDDIEAQEEIKTKYSEEDFNKAVDYIDNLEKTKMTRSKPNPRATILKN